MKFSLLNQLVLYAYLAGMLIIGWWFAGRQKTTEDYFLAGRKMPWLAVAMSMYASLTSAVTYMGLPSAAFRENISLIVVAFISPLVAPFLIYLFYPFYRRLKITTSYEYILKRFGPSARTIVAAFFILARLGWLGVVVYAPALALSVVSGLPLGLTIVLMGAIATAYTFLGGISADIWTDVVQFLIMLVGAVWLVVALISQVPDGFSGILAIARESHRLTVTDWHLNLFVMSAPVVAVTFFFQLMQDYGTDQATVQRLMTIPTFRGMAKAVFFNAFSDFFFISLLLFIGLGLFAFQQTHPDVLPASVSSDSVMPYYIIHALPNGVSGLLVAAIFAAAMSSMDSGLNSIATVVVNDFGKPLRGPGWTDAAQLRLAKSLTLVLGVFATGIAFYVSRFEHLIQAYTSIISLFNAPILGLFLLGIFSRRTPLATWIIGVAVAIPATLWLQNVVKAHWIYYFPFSLLVTLVVGYAAGFFVRSAPAPAELTIWGRDKLKW